MLLIVSLLLIREKKERLPVDYLFTLSDDVVNIVWWTFPIAEILTAIISIFILRNSSNAKIRKIKDNNVTDNLIISISREHGTNGKKIAKLFAK